MKLNVITSLVFIFCFTTLFCANGATTFARELRIKKIEINNETANWGAFKLSPCVRYSKLSAEGIPENLEIRFNINSMAFLFDIDEDSLSHYRYKLIGKDSTWKNINKSNEARYMYIKPGLYTFVLQEFDGINILQEKKFHFKRSAYSDESISSDVITLIYNLIFLGIFYSTIKQVENAKPKRIK